MRAQRTVSDPTLWSCPKCREQFSSRSQWHSCGGFELEPLFTNSRPHVRPLFDAFLKLTRTNGPLKVIPQRSGIALQVRIRFAALTPQKAALKGYLMLAERVESPRFERIDTYSPTNHVHVFRIASKSELDEEFGQWVAMAYDVGCQRHLG